MSRRTFDNSKLDAVPADAPTKVLVVGQTPPPRFGQAVMIELLVNGRLADLHLYHVRMNFSSHMDEMGRFRISKVWHMLSVVARIIYQRFAHDVRVLYYPPAGNYRVPMYRDVFILLCTRWLFDKTVFHFHACGISELHDRLPAWQRWLYRKAYFGADSAIRISDLNPEDGRRLAASRHYVIPNGIEDPDVLLTEPGESAESAARLARNGDGGLAVLYVGILSEAKGLLVLIEACGQLAARGVPFNLELMGQWEGSEFESLTRRRIEQLDLNGHVTFLGVLSGEQKFDAFRRSDVFCFPTHLECETFGLVLLEAMACRLPVVATRWRGIPSVVDDGETGFLFEPRDPQGLAERLTQLAGDVHLRERMGRSGRRKFEREYTLTRHLERMRHVLLATAGRNIEEATEWGEDKDADRVSSVANECEREVAHQLITACRCAP